MDYLKDKFSKMDGVTALLVVLIAIPSVFVIIFLAVLWHAWAVVTLWAWFIVPTFGVAALGYWQAAGIVTTVAIIKPNVPLSKEATDSKHLWARALFTPPVAVAVGWFYKYMAGM
jgi:hypothetical protein